MSEFTIWIIFIFLEVATVLKAQTITIDESTVASMSCLTVGVNRTCSSSTHSLLYERGVGNCSTLLDYDTTIERLTCTNSVCLPAGTNLLKEFCYRVSLLYMGNATTTVTNINAPPCSVRALEKFLGEGVNYVLDSFSGRNEMVVHLTSASLKCTSQAQILVGNSKTKCIRGKWISSISRTCRSTISDWIITPIIIIDIALMVVVAMATWLFYHKRKQSNIILDLHQIDDPVYETLDKDERISNPPRTQDNIAYGSPNPKAGTHTQNIPTLLDDSVYENTEEILSHSTQTEINVAYGCMCNPDTQRGKQTENVTPKTQVEIDYEEIEL